MRLFCLVFLVLSLLSVKFTHAQRGADYLNVQVNEPSPAFSLSDVAHFEKRKVRLEDFKGKWLVLDFWSKTCASCIASFPKLNAMQKQFAGQMQFLLIGNNETRYNSGIQAMFEKIRKYQNLDLAIAYDSLLFRQFNVRVIPTVVVIDPAGIIRKISTSGELTRESLKELINGKPSDTTVDTHDFVSSSSLSRWTKKDHLRSAQKIDYDVLNARFSASGMPLFKLYNLAYFGETDWDIRDSVYSLYCKNPILELKDSAAFFEDFSKQIGYFNYELRVPKAKAGKGYLQFAMQCDLKKAFGYQVSVEKRMMPCWELRASKEALKTLKSRSKELIVYASDHSGFNLKGVSIREVLETVHAYHQSGLSLFDKTGIDFLIDIRIDADLTNFNDFKAALEARGLKLVPGQREMMVIVIRDGAEGQE
jgi:thiol-disulfide isomerase/thioredoxin